MPARGGGLNPRFGAVVSRVLERFVSLEQAAIKIEYALTPMTLSRMGRGKVGLQQTVRSFAEGFWEHLCALYGQEIQADFGECNSRTAADWLAGVAGFGLAASDRVGEAFAGYSPTEAKTIATQAAEAFNRTINGRDRLIERLLMLKEQYPEKTIPVPLLQGGARGLTPEEADSIADDIEDKIRRGVL